MANEDINLADADRAAEQLAAAQRANPGADIKPGFDDARGDALDQALSSVLPNPETPELGRENGGVNTELEGAPKGVVTESAAASAAVTAAATSAETAASSAAAQPKSLLDDLLGNTSAAVTAATSSAADPYGEIKLRSDASPKTRETFEQMRTLARERETTLQRERDEISTRLAEQEKLVKELQSKTTELPEDIRAELEDHRKFRVQFDVENTPEFKTKFDSRINANYETIYSRLQQHGLPQTEVDKLKSFSPADRDAAIDTFLAKLPPESRRVIEAKLVDNVAAVEERTSNINLVRSKASEILVARQQKQAEALAQRDAEIASTIKPALAKLEWIHFKEVPANAAPEEKKRLEAHNAFAADLQDALRTAIIDDSPKTRAEAALAVPLARYYGKAYKDLQVAHDAALKKLKAIEDASSTSRTARTLANPRPAAAPAPKAPADSGDALDQLFNQAVASGQG